MENLEKLLSSIDKKLSEFNSPNSNAAIVEPKDPSEPNRINFFDDLIKKTTTTVIHTIKEETDRNPGGPVATIPIWVWIKLVKAFIEFITKVIEIFEKAED